MMKFIKVKGIIEDGNFKGWYISEDGNFLNPKMHDVYAIKKKD